MRIGDLCKIIKDETHTKGNRKGDLIMITKLQEGSVLWRHIYVEAINLRTHRFHHYKTAELEVISESR